MDNRHQSEREYIRYHGATSGEHLVAGIHGLAHGEIPTRVGPQELPDRPERGADADTMPGVPQGSSEA